MRIFPKRDPEKKRQDTGGWLGVFVLFVAIATAGFGVAFAGWRHFPWQPGTVGDTVLWFGPIIGIIAVILAFQALAAAFVE
ncbi:hypothetical protein ACEWPM_001035 [Roseovarius sp. S4756]|uniref:hypothetical protein n=1 Tax=Roseovarius maritimus TaxID=3342637 RepID=UPI0037265ABE